MNARFMCMYERFFEKARASVRFVVVWLISDILVLLGIQMTIFSEEHIRNTLFRCLCHSSSVL